MTNFIRIGIGILTAGLLSGCLFLDGAFHDDQLHEFWFRTKDNPELRWDERGTVSGKLGSIVVLLPSDADRTSLVPSFETGALRVTCEGRTVESARTALDFRTPRTFHVEAADGTSRDWVVTVKLKEPQLHHLKFSTSIAGQNPIEFGWFEEIPSSFVVNIRHPWTTTGIQLVVYFDFGRNPPSARLDNEELPVSWSYINLPFAVFELASISSQVPHTFSFPRGDGTTVSYTFTFELKPLVFESFEFDSSDNPKNNGKTVLGSIDSKKKTVNLEVPFSADAASLKPSFTHPGLKVRNGAAEVVSGTTALDFSAPVTLTIDGAEGTSEAWLITVTKAAPSTAKELKAIRFYRATSSPVQSAPTSSYRIEGIDLDPTENSIYWDPSSVQYFSKKAIYVEIVTTGVEVSAPGKNLSQGYLSDYPAVYDPANWLDFTAPIDLTIHAEDGSTRVLTITMDDPL